MRKRNPYLGNNREFGFLYKTVTIRPNVISEMAFVPEYMEALRNYKGTLTEEVIYQTLRDTYKQMLESGRSYRTARDVMNKVSRDVRGDSAAWKSEINYDEIYAHKRVRYSPEFLRSD